MHVYVVLTHIYFHLKTRTFSTAVLFYFYWICRFMRQTVKSRQCNVALTYMKCENGLSTTHQVKCTLWTEWIEKGIAPSAKIYLAIQDNQQWAMPVAIRSGRWSRYKIGSNSGSMKSTMDLLKLNEWFSFLWINIFLPIFLNLSLWTLYTFFLVRYLLKSKLSKNLLLNDNRTPCKPEKCTSYFAICTLDRY